MLRGESEMSKRLIANELLTNKSGSRDLRRVLLDSWVVDLFDDTARKVALARKAA